MLEGHRGRAVTEHCWGVFCTGCVCMHGGRGSGRCLGFGKLHTHAERRLNMPPFFATFVDALLIPGMTRVGFEKRRATQPRTAPRRHLWQKVCVSQEVQRRIKPAGPSPCHAASGLHGGSPAPSFQMCSDSSTAAAPPVQICACAGRSRPRVSGTQALPSGVPMHRSCSCLETVTRGGRAVAKEHGILTASAADTTGRMST
jgi:hypothetical protein